MARTYPPHGAGEKIEAGGVRTIQIPKPWGSIGGCPESELLERANAVCSRQKFMEGEGKIEDYDSNQL